MGCARVREWWFYVVFIERVICNIKSTGKAGISGFLYFDLIHFRRYATMSHTILRPAICAKIRNMSQSQTPVRIGPKSFPASSIVMPVTLPFLAPRSTPVPMPLKDIRGKRTKRADVETLFQQKKENVAKTKRG
jgi:hypothetical protein